MAEFGMGLASEDHPPQDLLRFAAQAEEGGWDFAVLSDHGSWTACQWLRGRPRERLGQLRCSPVRRIPRLRGRRSTMHSWSTLPKVAERIVCGPDPADFFGVVCSSIDSSTTTTRSRLAPTSRGSSLFFSL